MSNSPLKVAIVGAGISGLTLAKNLADTDCQHRVHVDIFEKSRGVGGRTSTRRAEPFQFDHGAPFFTCKSLDFQQFLYPLLQAGVLTDWQANVVEMSGTQVDKRYLWQANSHFVGIEKMNAIAKYLASQLPDNVDIKLGTRVAHIEKMKSAAQEIKWALTSDAGIKKVAKNKQDNNIAVKDKVHTATNTVGTEAANQIEVNQPEQNQANADLGYYDWVICTAPAQQASQLVPKFLPFHASIADHNMQGCYALMLGFDDDIAQHMTIDFDVALIKNSILSCITVNSAKPNRPDTGYCFTVLSDNQWADTHIDADQSWVQLQLLHAVSDSIGYDVIQQYRPIHIGMHRWRFANTNPHFTNLNLTTPDSSTKQLSDSSKYAPFLLDAEHQFAVAGDWLLKSSLENAFISGYTLGKRLQSLMFAI